MTSVLQDSPRDEQMDPIGRADVTHASPKLPWVEGDWTTTDWATTDWASINWASIDWAGINWAGIDWASIDWVSIDWASIDWARVGRSVVDPATGAVRVDRVRSWSGPTTHRGRSLTMHAYREERPGPRWQALLQATWPAYRAWYLSEGEHARPSLAECRQALQRHMPELIPTWQRLTDLAAAAGADADLAGRLLSLWRAPAYVSACSQAVLPGSRPVLVRNYDYDPNLFEGVVASTRYSGRQVIGTSDCLWGLLDGMNDDGLTVSLTLGGRPGSGPGFSIPIVVRYLLETCSTVPQAVARLEGLPIAQAYNLTFADREGRHATVFVAPGEAPLRADLAAVTNHRLTEVEHPAMASRLLSVQRQEALLSLLRNQATADDLVEAMLTHPLRATRYDVGFGTLYTAEYRPADGTVTYHWPDRSWSRRFADDDAVLTVELSDDLRAVA